MASHLLLLHGSRMFVACGKKYCNPKSGKQCHFLSGKLNGKNIDVWCEAWPKVKIRQSKDGRFLRCLNCIESEV